MTRRETAQEIEEAAALWAARLDRAPLTAEEERALEAWLAGDVRRAGAFAKARAVALHTERARALGPQFDAAAFAPQTIFEPQVAARPTRRVAFGAIAAVLAGVIVSGLPKEVTVGRYHSIYADPVRLPDEFIVTAETEDGVIMAFEHKREPIAAVQFHPESIMTLGHDAGMRMIEGTRSPPSQVSAFMPRSPPVLPPNQGPLSDVNITKVRSWRSSSSSASSSRPTFQSNSAITSP